MKMMNIFFGLSALLFVQGAPLCAQQIPASARLPKARRRFP